RSYNIRPLRIEKQPGRDAPHARSHQKLYMAAKVLGVGRLELLPCLQPTGPGFGWKLSSPTRSLPWGAKPSTSARQPAKGSVMWWRTPRQDDVEATGKPRRCGQVLNVGLLELDILGAVTLRHLAGISKGAGGEVHGRDLRVLSLERPVHRLMPGAA